MNLSDTRPRVRKLSHFWGGGGRELAASQYSIILWLTFLCSLPFEIKYSVSFTSLWLWSRRSLLSTGRIRGLNLQGILGSCIPQYPGTVNHTRRHSHVINRLCTKKEKELGTKVIMVWNHWEPLFVLSWPGDLGKSEIKKIHRNFRNILHCLCCKHQRKSVEKSVKRGVRVAKRTSLTRPNGLSPVSLSVFSLVPDLLFDCSRVGTWIRKNTDCFAVYTHWVWKAKSYCESRNKYKPFHLRDVAFCPQRAMLLTSKQTAHRGKVL